MTVTKTSRAILRGVLIGGAICIAASVPAFSQVQSTESVEHGTPTTTVKVERGVVEYVVGNDLLVKMDDGSIRHFSNVPDSVTVTVDGQQLNIHQLKPGMHLEKQTITTTTPRVVTTVETVTGKVWHVQPPNHVTLTMDNGENQRFNIPPGQKFTINGEVTDAFGLRKGMVVSAQRVREVPETVITQEFKRTGKMPPPPPEPKADVPLLVVYVPAPAPPVESAEAAEPAPTKLPKTASEIPLIGALGLFFCGLALMIRTTSGTGKHPIDDDHIKLA
jgi:hypothetical protein